MSVLRGRSLHSPCAGLHQGRAASGGDGTRGPTLSKNAVGHWMVRDFFLFFFSTVPSLGILLMKALLGFTQLN